MKYVFFGTPEFAAGVLQKLIAANMPPDILVANPDRPFGRKQVITAPLTKQLIGESGLSDRVRILQPEKLSPVPQEIIDLKPDFFVVAAYAKILRPDILSIPRLGTIGVHPSLLPKFRGASPIQSALLSGEAKTGVALYRMGVGVDDGPVYKMQAFDIGERNYPELETALADLAGEMLVSFIPEFLADKATAVDQDEKAATLTRKFVSEDGFIELEYLLAALAGDKEKSLDILRKIRALNPEPGTWTVKDGKRIKLLKAGLADGILKLELIQREGKTPEEYKGKNLESGI